MAMGQVRSLSACLTLNATLAAVVLMSSKVQAAENFERAVHTMEKGRCEQARPIVNAGLADGDPQVFYLAGYMFSRGLCVAPDPARALKLLEAAAKAGQADAAMELTLMHGMGRGVPQSYAQAGRWAMAAADIEALSSVKAVAAGPKTIDAGTASALGYIGTVHALVADEVRVKRPEWIQQMTERDVAVRVTVAWPDRALRTEASRSGGPLQDVATTFVSGAAPMVDQLKAAYAKAIRTAPPLSCAKAPCSAQSQARQYEFSLQ
jgi:TPR repeat protein